MPIAAATTRPVSIATPRPEPKKHEDLGHTLGHFFKHLGEDIFDEVAKVPGYIQLTGLRYPVHHYSEKVDAGLTRGSRLENRQDYEKLKAQGFKSIVDLTLEGTKDSKYAKDAGLNTHRVKIVDNGTPSMSQMKEFLDFVTKPENSPAYVHCEAGVGRTGIAVAAYRLAVMHEPLDKVLADADKHGMSLHSQVEFAKKFERALSAGQIEGYTRW